MTTSMWTTLEQAEHCTKLAAFLRTDIVQEHWNFKRILKEGDDFDASKGPVGCDSTACAMGWTPVCFPNDWRYSKGCDGFYYVDSRNPITKDNPGWEQFYGMDYETFRGVFGVTEAYRSVYHIASKCSVTPSMVADKLDEWAITLQQGEV